MVCVGRERRRGCVGLTGFDHRGGIGLVGWWVLFKLLGWVIYLGKGL